MFNWEDDDPRVTGYVTGRTHVQLEATSCGSGDTPMGDAKQGSAVKGKPGLSMSFS